MLNFMVPTILLITMNFMLILVAILLSGITRVKTTLKDDIIDIMESVPLNELQNLVNYHMRDSTDFECGIQYLQSEEFENLYKNMRQTEEFETLVKYMKIVNFDFDFYASYIWSFVKNISTSADPASCETYKNSLKKFLVDAESVLSSGRISQIIDYKIDHSAAFREFIRAIGSKYFEKLTDDVLSKDQTKSFIDKLKFLGCECENYVEILKETLSWD